MDSIVSLLDEHHALLLEDLWSSLATRFGLEGVAVTPFPHISWQVVAGYNIERLDKSLKRCVATAKPFMLRTTGLGIFTGKYPVLMIPVVRTLTLSRLHQHLWSEGLLHGTDVSPLYAPERWMPHITLAHGDLNPQRAAAAVAYMLGMELCWDVRVDNLALIHQTDGLPGIHGRYRFAEMAGGRSVATKISGANE